jgi:polysaccharide biosynthesis PFTS motif protein
MKRKKKGAQITSYFYSISEEFKLSTGYQPNSTFWELMNWPLYLVWDSYQEDLIRRNVGDFFLIKNVGPILFENVPTELPEIPKNSVAIFDVQPIRSSAHFGFSTQAELYLNPRVPERFIQEIVSVLSMFNFTIVHKRKRNDGNRAVKHYRNLIKDLLRHKNVISVEPSISAIRVIQNCKAVISMPFTSTAIIGRDLGKPSIYYDPIGVIQKDDKGAHGIPIISGQEELMSWLKIVLNKP